MVKGLDLFRETFRPFAGSFILIGGAACDQWFTDNGLTFRATRDLDLVLVIEVLDPACVAALRRFVAEGGYEIRERTAGAPILHRFARPTREEFPSTLEFFSRSPAGFDLAPDQTIIPVATGPDPNSLSAILLDADYYDLIRTHQDPRDGLGVANATALIPLKARAWLDLNERRANGDPNVDARDLDKHRTDVFRLAGTLRDEPGPELPAAIRADLIRFLRSFPEDSGQWPAIGAALQNTFGRRLPRPAALRQAVQTTFRLLPA